MSSVNELSLGFNKRIKVNIDSGDLTSDAGLLLYKEFDAKIGLSELIQSSVIQNDPVEYFCAHKRQCDRAKDLPTYRGLSRR